jgi:DNA-binding NarL/FixJ family response regulator
MTTPTPITVSIVEDGAALGRSLMTLLNGSPGFSCAGVHGSAESALKNIPRDKPDVVLMDLHLPGRSGIECVQELKTRFPKLNILMLTIEQDSRLVFEALQAGACGYLVKDVPYAKMLEAIEEVHRGGAPMSSQIARQVIQFFHHRSHTSRELETLTPREQEILRLLAEGYHDKEIAAKLGVQVRTIAAHCHNIYEKLHVHSRAAAVAKYLRRKD